MGNIFYQTKTLTMRKTRLKDARQLTPFVRQSERRECFDLSGLNYGKSLMKAVKAAKICCTYKSNGNVLVISGVTDISEPEKVSRRLSLLSGYGGLLFAASRDEASLSKFEGIRRAAPLFYRMIFNAGYDYITTWCADYMAWSIKLDLHFGFHIREKAVCERGTFYRLEWKR